MTKARKSTLSPQQEAFCQNYVSGMSATAAYIEAGYKPGTASKAVHVLLKNPKVAERLAELRAQRAKEHDITAERVLGELARVAFASITDVVAWKTVKLTHPETGQELYVPAVDLAADSADLDPAIRAAVAEVSLSKDGTFKVKMHDKLVALDKLSRHLGLFEKDNEQKADPLAALILATQGRAIPIQTHLARRKRQAEKAGNA